MFKKPSTSLWVIYFVKIQALTITVRGPTLDVDCRRQILTTKVDPRTVRVKIFIMVVDS